MSTTKFNPQDAVFLIPTEGGYQSPKPGIVTRVTHSRIEVKADHTAKIFKFDSETLRGATKYDREFPNYRLELAAPAAATPEIKTAPLIEVQVINKGIAEQIARVENVEQLSQENYEKLREKHEPIAYIPALCDVLARLDGQLIRIHFLVYAYFEGPGRDQIDAQKRKINELPQLFLK